MQTILTVMRSNRGFVDDYLARFCARLANEEQAIEASSSSSHVGDVAFAKDDVYHQVHGSCDEEQPARLGSFGQLSNNANCRQVIFMDPIILMYRNNGQHLRLWVTAASPEAGEDSES